MIRITLSVVCALLMLGSSVFADEVVLKDGSRIVGKVKTLGGGTITIEGGSAGTVTIPFENVRSLSTDADQKIVLADGTEVEARFATSDDGKAELVTAMGRESVNLMRVQAIDPPAEPPAVTHEGNVTLSGKIAEYVRRAEDNRLTINASWNYAEDQGNLSERNSALRGKYDHFFNEKLFGYANLSFERDDFADLNLRTTAGAGAGYQFVENDEFKYYEEIGVSYFDEDFDAAEDDDYATSRISGKFDWVITPDKVTFFHFHEIFWSLEETDDILVDTSTGVRLTIIENFFASFQINYRWDNTPAAGTLRSDTEYLLGLGYSYTF